MNGESGVHQAGGLWPSADGTATAGSVALAVRRVPASCDVILDEVQGLMHSLARQIEAPRSQRGFSMFTMACICGIGSP